MIAFNGQYLDKASHGNMRITDACLGGQWVMGGWLKTATQQAIIAAFGAEEGIAVISRANGYISSIATTDPTRAQQLALFINEDPLLVTSLVETSKERWLVGDGDLISETSFQKGGDLDVQIEFISNNTTSTWGAIFWQGSSQGGNDSIFLIGFNGSTSKGYAYIGKQNYYSSITYTNGRKMTLRLKNQEGFWFDGVKAWSTTKLSSNLKGQLVVGGGYDKRISNLSCKDTDNSIDWNFVPFVGEDGVPCLLDINTCQERMINTTGQFTIAVTDKE